MDILSITSNSKILSLLSAALLVSYAYKLVTNRTELICLSDFKDINNQKLVNFLSKIQYKPTTYLAHSITQLLFHAIFKPPKISIKREYYVLKCGGTVALDYAVFPHSLKNNNNHEYNIEITDENGKTNFPDSRIDKNHSSISNNLPEINKKAFYKSNNHPLDKNNHVCKNKKILIVMHGVLGGTNTAQLKDIVDFYSSKENLFFDQIVCIQNKGINDTPLAHPKPYNAYSYEDIKQIIDYLIEINKNIDLYLIGISMGSLLISQMLIKYPNISNIKGFSSISNPYNLKNSYNNMNYIEQRYLSGVLKKSIINQPILNHKVSYNELSKYHGLLEMEEKFTLAVHDDIESVDFYLEDCSVDKRINEIQYYSLFINSEDDKLSPIEKVDLNQCKLMN